MHVKPHPGAQHYSSINVSSLPPLPGSLAFMSIYALNYFDREQRNRGQPGAGQNISGIYKLEKVIWVLFSTNLYQNTPWDLVCIMVDRIFKPHCEMFKFRIRTTT